MRLITYLLIFILAFPFQVFAADENLDEVVARQSRHGDGTYLATTLEDSGNYYIWQPETLCYLDVTSGKEVWRLIGGNNKIDSLPDYGLAQYSADGKRISFRSVKATDAINNSYDESADYGNRMVALSDGTKHRVAAGCAAEAAVHSGYFHWSPVEPDVAYQFGRNYASEGLNNYDLYKVTVSDTSISRSLWLSFPSTKGELSLKKAMSADGKKLIANDANKRFWFPATIYPSASLDDADGYTSNRPDYDDYWGNTTGRELSESSNNYHDQYLAGGVDCDNGIWFFIVPESTDGSWWKIRPTGSDADGGPSHTSDNATPYSWGDEMKPTHTTAGTSPSEGTCIAGYRDPYCCDDDGGTTQCSVYPSHFTPDRYGRYILFSNTPGATIGTGIWDEDTHTYEIEKFASSIGAEHHSWSAWSDWSASSGTDLDRPNQGIHTQDYTDINSRVKLCTAHIATYNSPSVTAYNRLARPTQSPDGTKIMFHTSFMNYDKNIPDLLYVVAYYPYAPEISATTATGGTTTITVWWNLGTTPRGYTERGWPSEVDDDPPPPREIKEFRLWRSADKVTWIPIKTFTYDIWDKLDFSDGTWDSGTEATNKWSTTDSVADGTYYYAITSIEHSGLESRTLSNIYSITVSSGSGTGSQDTAYSSNPGGDADITSSYDSDLHRYYNIYAEDGSTPSISQTNKIASDPRTDKSFIDVFGNSNDSTLYTITAVDTQGNESTAFDETVQTDTPSAGLYTITWDDEVITAGRSAIGTGCGNSR